MDDILDKCGETFHVHEMMAKTEDRSPYTIVAFQECERMNILTNEMKRSLRELSLGLKVLIFSLKFIPSHKNWEKNEKTFTSMCRFRES